MGARQEWARSSAQTAMGAMASTVIAAPQHQLGEVAGRNVEVAARDGLEEVDDEADQLAGSFAAVRPLTACSSVTSA
jgi:hypothetical protein